MRLVAAVCQIKAHSDLSRIRQSGDAALYLGPRDTLRFERFKLNT